MPKHRILMVEVVLIYQGNTWLFCKNNIIQGKKKGTRFDFVQTQAGASILDPSHAPKVPPENVIGMPTMQRPLRPVVQRRIGDAIVSPPSSGKDPPPRTCTAQPSAHGAPSRHAPEHLHVGTVVM